jgi:hypothetical protein
MAENNGCIDVKDSEQEAKVKLERCVQGNSMSGIARGGAG